MTYLPPPPECVGGVGEVGRGGAGEVGGGNQLVEVGGAGDVGGAGGAPAPLPDHTCQHMHARKRARRMHTKTKTPLSLAHTLSHTLSRTHSYIPVSDAWQCNGQCRWIQRNVSLFDCCSVVAVIPNL